LLENVVDQPMNTWLIHRIREQARSHMGVSLPGGSLYGTALAVQITREMAGGQEMRTNPDTGRQ
jgi:hypothetical protein